MHGMMSPRAGRTLYGFCQLPVEHDHRGHGCGSISYPAEADPTHTRAWHDVETGAQDYAEVRDDKTSAALFRAWRVSPSSWAWQTSIMPAPAFGTYC